MPPYNGSRCNRISAGFAAFALDRVSERSRKTPNEMDSACTDDWSNIVRALIPRIRGGPQPVAETTLASTTQ